MCVVVRYRYIISTSHLNQIVSTNYLERYWLNYLHELLELYLRIIYYANDMRMNYLIKLYR